MSPIVDKLVRSDRTKVKNETETTRHSGLGTEKWRDTESKNQISRIFHGWSTLTIPIYSITPCHGPFIIHGTITFLYFIFRHSFTKTYGPTVTVKKPTTPVSLIIQYQDLSPTRGRWRPTKNLTPLFDLSPHNTHRSFGGQDGPLPVLSWLFIVIVCTYSYK